MLIDWFTVIAQVLNFLILVWLLKRFLYKPILNAIDARENKVVAELANAASKEAEAKKEKEEFKHKNEEFDQQRAALLSKAKDEVKAERHRLLEEVRKEASDLSSKHQEALRNEIQNLNREISRRTEQEVLAITRKVLKDLAGTNLEDRMVDVFVQRLHELKGEEKEQLVSAFKISPRHVLIRTAFALSQKQRDLIKETIKETLGMETQADFKTDPELVSGIELTADGQKIAWSIADYLSSLERSIDELLKEKSKSEIKTRSESEPEPEKSKSKPDQPESEDSKPKPDQSKLKESKLKPDQPEPEDSKPKPGPEQEIKPNPNSRQRADEHGA